MMNNGPDPELQRLRSHNAPHEHADARSSGGLRMTLIAAAIVILGGGALLSRGNLGGSHTSPAAAGKISGQNVAASKTALHAAAQFAMIAPENAPKALAASTFNPQQRQQILAAVKRREMRLVEMPIADASGQAGQTVTVLSAGIPQTVVLTGKLQSVLLPIRDAGEVTISPVTPPHGTGLQTGILTALGPVILPTLTSLTQQIVLDVIVQ